MITIQKKLLVPFFSLICILSLFSDVSAERARFGVMKGVLLSEGGEPLSYGRVSFYNVDIGPSPFSHEYWRVRDRSSITDNDGSFSIKLPAGAYYLTASKKGPGLRPGPPDDVGDLVYPPRDGREPKVYVIKAGETTDIGVIAGAVPFKKEWAVTGKSGITGTVKDPHGKPMQGVLVYVSGTPEMDKPLFVSDSRTAGGGRYIVRVPDEGQYHVKAVGSSEPVVKATVKKGEITKGIDIIVEKNPGVPEWSHGRK